MRRAAFTLTELLVGMGIVAVLLSLALPALSRTREAARAAACMSNLHQAGTLTQMYIMDHADTFPFFVSNVPVPGVGGAVSQRQAMAGYVENLTVFRCPQDERVRRGQADEDYTSYAYPPGDLMLAVSLLGYEGAARLVSRSYGAADGGVVYHDLDFWHPAGARNQAYWPDWRVRAARP